MADPKEYLARVNNTHETMGSNGRPEETEKPFDSSAYFARVNNTFSDQKPEQAAKAPEANKPGDKKPDLGVHDQAQWQNVVQDKKPSEEKPKPVVTAAAPILPVITLTASSLAISGTGNQVLPKSDDVHAMQKQLIALGYDIGSKDGTPDGRLGPKTREAAAEAMKKGGLDPATTTIAELTERARMHIAYAAVTTEEKQKLAQKTTTPGAVAEEASASQKRQPIHFNNEMAQLTGIETKPGSQIMAVNEAGKDIIYSSTSRALVRQAFADASRLGTSPTNTLQNDSTLTTTNNIALHNVQKFGLNG